MKTWQVFALVAAIVGAGWLLFRRRGGLALIPGTTTVGGTTPVVPGSPTGTPVSSDGTSAGGPPSSFTLLDAWKAAGDIYSGFSSGQLTSAQVVAAQQQLIANARAAGMPIATGPATESLSGRAHF